MGRREKKNKQPMFIHDNMFNIIPDIPSTNIIQQREKIPSIPMKKLPSKALGKKYEVLPHLGESEPPSSCNNATRLAPCIEVERLSEPTAKKLRTPLACLDVENIRKKIDKAEKKQKKAKKKMAKPPPKEARLETEKLNEQIVNMFPQVHIPHPPLYPLDPTMLRRIVKIKKPTSFIELTTEQYVSLMTSAQEPCLAGDPWPYTNYANPEQFMEYADPYSGGMAPEIPEYMNSFQDNGYMNAPDLSSGYINPDQYVNLEYPCAAGGVMPNIHQSRFAPEEMYGGGRFTNNRDYKNQCNNASQKTSMHHNPISIDSHINI